MLQEYMVKTGDSEIFFFKHSFKSARQHAEEYLKRNKNKGKLWGFIHIILIKLDLLGY